MIIVSSFRPFETCSNTVWLQQEAANRSWVRLFDRIFYFNHSDPRMKSAKTAFLPTNGKPSIKKMAAFGGGLNDWSCLVNADIVIPQNFRRVEEALRGQPAGCAVSRRYTLPADGDTATARLTELAERLNGRIDEAEKRIAGQRATALAQNMQNAKAPQFFHERGQRNSAP